MQTAESEKQRSAPRKLHSFDSLAFAKRLQAGGAFTREQAEMLAEEQAALIDDRLATKEDVALINANIEAMRLATEKDIETATQRTKAEILKWMFGQTVVIIAAMIGILRAGAH
jgi:uncharacterized protein